MTDPALEALHAAAAAAREGMGVEEPAKDEAVEGQEEKEMPEIETPVENPEPEAPKGTEGEGEDTEETPAEEESTGDEPDEDPSEEGSQDRTSVYGQLNNIRSQKREADQVIRKMLEATGATSAEDALAAITKLKESQPVPQAFQEFAKQHGIEDPKVLRDLYDVFGAETKREMNEALKPFREQLEKVQGTISETENKNAWNDSLAHMDTEWKGVLPQIEQAYKPDAAKISQAHDLMAELAHSEKYHDKELDYILYKEAPQFEAIFGAPKRKTMFSARAPLRAPEQKKGSGQGLVRSDGSHQSIMEAKERLAAIKNGAGFSENESLN